MSQLTLEPKIYLAGAVAHSEFASEWRRDIEIAYGSEYNFVNPLNRLDVSDDKRYNTMEDEQIVESDLSLIDECDGVFLYWDPSIATFGSVIESYYAASELEIPVGAWYQDKIGTESPWLRHYCVEVSTYAAEVLSEIEKNV